MSIQTADDFKQASEPFPVDLAPGRTILVRRSSFLTLLFTGNFPQHLSAALDRIESGDFGSSFTQLTAIPDLGDLLEAMRHWAVHVGVQPRFVFVDEHEAMPEGAVDVRTLLVDELLTIFRAQPPARETRAPHLREVDAERFRDGAAGGVGAPVPTGESVPSGAVVVDPA